MISVSHGGSLNIPGGSFEFIIFKKREVEMIENKKSRNFQKATVQQLQQYQQFLFVFYIKSIFEQYDEGRSFKNIKSHA